MMSVIGDVTFTQDEIAEIISDNLALRGKVEWLEKQIESMQARDTKGKRAKISELQEQLTHKGYEARRWREMYETLHLNVTNALEQHEH